MQTTRRSPFPVPPSPHPPVTGAEITRPVAKTGGCGPKGQPLPVCLAKLRLAGAGGLDGAAECSGPSVWVGVWCGRVAGRQAGRQAGWVEARVKGAFACRLSLARVATCFNIPCQDAIATTTPSCIVWLSRVACQCPPRNFSFSRLPLYVQFPSRRVKRNNPIYTLTQTLKKNVLGFVLSEE